MSWVEGHSCIATTFLGSTLTPSLLTMCPKYSTLSPKRTFGAFQGIVGGPLRVARLYQHALCESLKFHCRSRYHQKIRFSHLGFQGKILSYEFIFFVSLCVE
jgi:hypothetical protein